MINRDGTHRLFEETSPADYTEMADMFVRRYAAYQKIEPAKPEVKDAD